MEIAKIAMRKKSTSKYPVMMIFLFQDIFSRAPLYPLFWCILQTGKLQLLIYHSYPTHWQGEQWEDWEVHTLLLPCFNLQQLLAPTSASHAQGTPEVPYKGGSHSTCSKCTSLDINPLPSQKMTTQVAVEVEAICLHFWLSLFFCVRLSFFWARLSSVFRLGSLCLFFVLGRICFWSYMS